MEDSPRRWAAIFTGKPFLGNNMLEIVPGFNFYWVTVFNKHFACRKGGRWLTSLALKLPA